MRKTYNVTLANQQCIFDDCSGYETIEEAISWATGRGYPYLAWFDVDGNEGEKCPDSVSCNDDDDFSIYDGWGCWDHYSAADLAKYLKRYL